MRAKTKHLLGIFISLAIGIASIILFISFSASNLFTTYVWLRYLVFGLGIASTFVFTFFMIGYFTFRRTIKNLAVENKYNLGIDFKVFNRNLFISVCDGLRKKGKYKNKKQYVIAFTASNTQVLFNFERSDAVIALNAKVADIMVDTFIRNAKNIGKDKHYVFGFDKGVFFLYCFGDNEAEVKSVIRKISVYIVDAIKKQQLHVWVEPLFGVVDVKPDDFLGLSIDNAIFARNIAEKNFENITFYQESYRRVASSDDTKEIFKGLENNEFVVYYQPKFDLEKKEFTSSEALVRWNSPKHGLLPPAKFIGIAEAAGLIHEIDTFVFKRVCEDLNDTKRRGKRLLPVSLNFSLHEFFSTSFLDTVINMLDEYNVDPKLIQIEITESTSQSNQFLSVSIIKKLKELGIKILMDDFGVGFSNIGNLRKIPFDVVKIDKSFIDNIDTDPKSAEIVKFLIQLCKVNGLEVVAEGVDNEKQVSLLKRFKCDTIQGYYYSKPIPKAEYDRFLISNPFEVKTRGGKK